MRLILTTAAIVLVAGCASQPSSAPAPASTPRQPAVNLSGYPPEFRQGYADGCASAGAGASRNRNEERYKSGGSYAQGWHDGYDICGRKK